MGRWHGTEYVEAETTFASGNEVYAQTVTGSRSYEDSPSTSFTSQYGGLDGGVTSTASTYKKQGVSGYIEQADNYTSSGITTQARAVEVNNDNAGDLPEDFDGSEPTEENEGQENEEAQPTAYQNDASDDPRIYSGSSSGKTEYTIGESPARNWVDSSFSNASKYGNTIYMDVEGAGGATPFEGRTVFYKITTESSAKTVWIHTSNHLFTAESIAHDSGGYSNSRTTGLAAMPASMYRAVTWATSGLSDEDAAEDTSDPEGTNQSNEDDEDSENGSGPTTDTDAPVNVTVSVSTESKYSSVKQTRGKTEGYTNKTLAERKDRGYTFGSYTYVVFIDNDTFYGNRTFTEPGGTVDNDLGSAQSVEDDDEAVKIDPKVEIEDQDGNTSGLTPDEDGEIELPQLPEVDPSPGESPGGVDQFVFSPMPQGGEKYSAGTYEDVGFSYGTAETHSTSTIYNSNGDSTEVPYTFTKVTYPEVTDEGDYYEDYCGNIDITRENYESYEPGEYFYNIYNRQTVTRKTEYALGGQKGVRAKDSRDGEGYSGLVDGSEYNFSSSASYGPRKYTEFREWSLQESHVKTVTGLSQTGTDGTKSVASFSDRDFTYWTVDLTNSRSSIGNFGMSPTVRIYDVASSVSDYSIFDDWNETDGVAEYEETQGEVDVPSRMTANQIRSTRDRDEYEAEYVDFVGTMYTISSDRVRFHNGQTTNETATRNQGHHNEGLTQMTSGLLGFIDMQGYSGDMIEIFTRIPNTYGILFQTKTERGEITADLSPPELNFTEEYLKSDISDGQTVYTIDERTDSFHSIPGEYSLVSDKRFYSRGLIPSAQASDAGQAATVVVTIPHDGGVLSISTNTITQVRSVQLTASVTKKIVIDDVPETVTDTSTYRQPLRRTIHLRGGLDNLDTRFSVGDTRYYPEEFGLEGGFFFGGGAGFDEPGTLNAGAGMGTIFNEDGETDLGLFGRIRTVELDTGLHFYKYPKGVWTYLDDYPGVIRFDRGIDPYDYYDPCL